MLFNSLEFPLFLTLVLLLFACLKTVQQRKLLLLLASLFFYGYWKWTYLFLLIGSAGIDFIAAIAISKAEKRVKKQLFLWISLSANLLILLYFKYSLFLGSAFFFEASQAPAWIPYLLPVGISFYTFQAMAYVIDVYRGRVEAEKSWQDYLLFITFFPQLVAGPIERAPQLMGQLKQIHIAANFTPGIMFILSGFFKKLVLADRLGIYVDQVFNQPGEAEPISIIIGTIFFGFQIYGDFSGYSDIARGCASFFGISLMANFRSPYLAVDLRDFWRRWHISLSGWFRDYLYHPLGGNRSGFLFSNINLFIVFCISGLWHGANWTFLIWGAWHGTGLLAQRLFTSFLYPGKLISRILTLCWVFGGWFFFRVNNLPDASLLWGKLMHSGFSISSAANMFQSKSELAIGLSAILLLMIAEAKPFESRLELLERWSPWQKLFFFLLGGSLLLWFGHFKGGDFIYFQF